ncbi:hypothetical protein MTR_3g035965 [Medicago truncatula]|uniref:Uncharacterized protein n=1 Tax=Medicago truncatula TaxID=3880 RepID=A0A072V5H8_MEDTR|nr:hypothetical protein MTR_3g035965 [Medicago truncatula]
MAPQTQMSFLRCWKGFVRIHSLVFIKVFLPNLWTWRKTYVRSNPITNFCEEVSTGIMNYLREQNRMSETEFLWIDLVVLALDLGVCYSSKS